MPDRIDAKLQNGTNSRLNVFIVGPDGGRTEYFGLNPGVTLTVQNLPQTTLALSCFDANTGRLITLTPFFPGGPMTYVITQNQFTAEAKGDEVTVRYNEFKK